MASDQGIRYTGSRDALTMRKGAGMHREMKTCFLLVVIVAMGCGDDDSKDASIAKCEAFASAWCDKGVSCAKTNGLITDAAFDDELDACLDVAIARGRCEKAPVVGDRFDECLKEIDSLQCSYFDATSLQQRTLEVPPSCMGLFTLRK